MICHGLTDKTYFSSVSKSQEPQCSLTALSAGVSMDAFEHAVSNDSVIQGHRCQCTSLPGVKPSAAATTWK